MNTLQNKDSKGIFGLFKGPSGSGKSVAALSFPSPFVFDYDFKMPNIALKHFPKKSIEYEQFTDTDQLSDIYKLWGKCPRCGYDRMCEKQGGRCGTSCPHETIIHDSITNMENLVIRTIADVKGENVPQMIKSLLKGGKSGSNKTDMMDFDYYKAEMRFSDWIISMSKILWAREGNPKHVIFTAHVVSTEQRNIMTGLITRTRSIVAQGNKVAAWIPTNFDEVYMFGFREVGGLDGNESEIKHICLTQAVGDDDAKTAFKLQKSIDFTNGNLYELINQQIEGSRLFD